VVDKNSFGSNGRAFVLLGDGLFDVRGFAINNERNGLSTSGRARAAVPPSCASAPPC